MNQKRTFCKFSPKPPARVEMRKQETSEALRLNASIILSLSPAGVLPSSRQYGRDGKCFMRKSSITSNVDVN